MKKLKMMIQLKPKNKIGQYYTRGQRIKQYHDVVWFVDEGPELRINTYIRPAIVVGNSCLLHTINGYKYCWYSTTFINDDEVWLLLTTNCHPNQSYTNLVCWDEVCDGRDNR